jgi:hypothetical protein
MYSRLMHLYNRQHSLIIRINLNMTVFKHSHLAAALAALSFAYSIPSFACSSLNKHK